MPIIPKNPNIACEKDIFASSIFPISFATITMIILHQYAKTWPTFLKNAAILQEIADAVDVKKARR